MKILKVKKVPFSHIQRGEVFIVQGEMFLCSGDGWAYNAKLRLVNFRHDNYFEVLVLE